MRSLVRIQLALSLSVAGLGPIVPLAAQDSTRATAERIAELEQKVKILARLRQIELDSAAEAARARPNVRPTGGGLSLGSPDGEWRLRVGGYVQADSRLYLGDAAAALVNTFLIRRARPLMEGTVARYFDFRIMADFGSGQPTIFEAWLEAKLDPAFGFRAGKFKPPIGLERLQSATDLRFIERGFPTNLAPNRDVGIQLGGELDRGLVTYQVGVFNGVPDLGFGDGDANDAKDVAARLFLVPFARQGPGAPIDLGVGIAFSTGNERGTVAAPQTSTYRSPGQAVVFRYRAGTTAATTVIADGRRSRVYPQAYLYCGPIGLSAELADNRHTVRRDTVLRIFHHRGWQLAGSVFLTGEKASYRSVAPKNVFDLKAKTWGAIELAVRYQGTQVDDEAFPFFADAATAARRVEAWGIGLNWYLAKNVKAMIDYERATFTRGGGAATGNRPRESFLATRFQFVY